MSAECSYRLLKPNQRQTMPERMVFFDTETNYQRIDNQKIIHKLLFGFACYWRHRRDDRADRQEWLRFEKADVFWDWLLAKTTRSSITYLIAHNLAFDFMVVEGFEQLARRGWQPVFIYESGHTRILKFGLPTPEFAAFQAGGGELADYRGRRWQKTLMAIDNANLFAGKLARWGETLGLAKLVMPGREDSQEAWDAYCRRDVEIMVRLWERWFEFLKEHDLGCWRPTIAGQAFGAYRHRFMHHKIWLHDNRAAVELERAAYYGGRSEAFRVGELDVGTVYKLDVNSMYPYVMREYEYPVALKEVIEPADMTDLVKALSKYAVVAEVEIETDEPVYPYHLGRRNVYPIGRFTSTLSTPELNYALEHGHVVGVHKLACYRTRPIFVEFVEYFYGLKVEYDQRGDRLNRSLIKLIMNSLYGKFGQRGFVDQWVRSCEPDRYEVEHVVSADGQRRYTLYRVGGSVIRSERKGEGHNAFVAIAGHVTAYARMYLWGLIQQAGREHVFYCDTDSLFVDQVGLDNLAEFLDESRLGGLKVEGVTERVTIHAPKDYEFGDHVKRKGVPADSLAMGDARWEVEIWPSLRGLLGAGVSDHYENRLVVKHLKREVKWGVLLPDGRVRPFVLPEEGFLSPEKLYEIECLQAQIDALRDSLILDSQTVFKFWDYVAWRPKRVRNKYGELVPWWQAQVDEVAQEWGFNSADAFIAEVERTASVYQTIRQLEDEIERIKSQTLIKPA